MTDGDAGPAASRRPSRPGAWRDRFREPPPGPPSRVVRAASLAYGIAALGVVAWGARAALEERSTAPLLFAGPLTLYPASLAWSVRSLRAAEGLRWAFAALVLLVFAHALVGVAGAVSLFVGPSRIDASPFAFVALAFYATWFGWILFLVLAPFARGWLRPALCAAYGPFWLWLWFSVIF